MRIARIITAAVAFSMLAFPLAGLGQSQGRAALTSEQQKALLSRRLPSGAITGTFGSFGSFLYAALDVAIHTDDKEIGDAELHSPFPDFYKPTLKELLDTIALQTGSSWAYDSQRDYWVFAKPARPKPYTIALADKWVANDRGVYVSYKPPTYPVGMDIYYYGVYSADDPEQEQALWEKIRDSWAIGFASNFKRGISIAEMQKVSVDGVEALYFETTTTRPGVIWRQWALVKNGKAFVIVSTLPSGDKQLLSDVEAMVKSFRVVS
jgi:hypothetical protein